MRAFSFPPLPLPFFLCLCVAMGPFFILSMASSGQWGYLHSDWRYQVWRSDFSDIESEPLFTSGYLKSCDVTAIIFTGSQDMVSSLKSTSRELGFIFPVMEMKALFQSPLFQIHCHVTPQTLFPGSCSVTDTKSYHFISTALFAIYPCNALCNTDSNNSQDGLGVMAEGNLHPNFSSFSSIAIQPLFRKQTLVMAHMHRVMTHRRWSLNTEFSQKLRALYLLFWVRHIALGLTLKGFHSIY